MHFDKTVEAIIQEAMQRGEFDNLANQGRPLDLSAYFDTPEELRLAYSVLKNAGVLPEEVELLKQIEALQTELEACSDPERQKALRQAIHDRRLDFNLRMERRRG